MDVQLKELIDKIKNDGVKSAEESAARIISDAEEQAAAIVDKAARDADSLRKTAKADAEKAVRSGREALRQAGRDLVLTVKGEIEKLFGRVLEAETAQSLDSELMKQVVAAAVKTLADEQPGDFDVLIPQKTMEGIEAGLMSALSEEMSKGLEIKPFKGLDAGFRISKKDGTAFFDFSEKEIAAMLGKYLNPKLSQLLMD
jgi:V/A-type H+-transporting ATPase subunit E